MALFLSFKFFLFIATCNGVVVHKKHTSLVNRKNKQIHDAKYDFDHSNSAKENDANMLFFDQYDEYMNYEENILNNEGEIEQNYYSAKTMIDDEDYGYRASYSDKDQLTAFALSLFMGVFGAGRFYVGDNAVGATKLCFTTFISFVICICSYLAYKVAKSNKDEIDQIIVGTETTNPSTLGPFIGITGVVTLISFCAFIGIAFWWFYDVILFGMNDITDSNGKTLIPW